MTKGRALTPQQVAELIEYDPATGSLTWKPRGIEWFSTAKRPVAIMNSWNAKHAGQPALNVPSNGYRQGWLLSVIEKAHIAAWAIYYGEWPTDQIDHIDRIRSNNRISNLRIATNAENCMNRPPRGKTLSRFRGVSLRPSGMWQARIKLNGKSRYLGQFKTEVEAAKAYDQAAARLHGEFAQINIRS